MITLIVSVLVLCVVIAFIAYCIAASNYPMSKAEYYAEYMQWLETQNGILFNKQGVPTDSMLNDMAIEHEHDLDGDLSTFDHIKIPSLLVCSACAYKDTCIEQGLDHACPHMLSMHIHDTSDACDSNCFTCKDWSCPDYGMIGSTGQTLYPSTSNPYIVGHYNDR
jgi:hypothetical protein